MVKRTHVTLVDDLTGEDIVEGKGGTVRFGLDGVEYTIDLTDANANRLRTAMSEFLDAGSRVGRATGRPGKRTSVGPSAREIRDWARSQGLSVPAKGRIPTEVREAFDART